MDKVKGMVADVKAKVTGKEEQHGAHSHTDAAREYDIKHAHAVHEPAGGVHTAHAATACAQHAVGLSSATPHAAQPMAAVPVHGTTQPMATHTVVSHSTVHGQPGMASAHQATPTTGVTTVDSHEHKGGLGGLMAKAEGMLPGHHAKEEHGEKHGHTMGTHY